MKETVADALARFLYANAIPFDVADSVEYKDMYITLLSQSPAYHPPDREALGTTLLQCCKAQVGKDLEKVMQIINVSSATPCSDGWTNDAQVLLYSIMLTTPAGALFCEMMAGTEEQKTAAWLAAQ